MSIFDHNIFENVRTRVIVLHNGRMLLISPHEAGASWQVPGGGLERNESLAECGEREVMEETGVEVKIGRVAFLREFVVPKYCPLPDSDGVTFTMEVYLYAAPTTDQIEPRRENPSAPLPYWIPLDQVAALPLWPKELKSLANALAAGHVPQTVPSFIGQLESPDTPAPDVTF
jgi:ADP-ribose pyrophosphatase YjhB (NUDIX family)